MLQYDCGIRCSFHLRVFPLLFKLALQTWNYSHHVISTRVPLHKLSDKHNSRCLSDHEGDAGEGKGPAVLVLKLLTLRALRTMTYLVVDGRNIENDAHRERQTCE